MSRVPPPSAGDILIAVAGKWPSLHGRDFGIEPTETSWRAVVESATPELRLTIWEALQRADDDEDLDDQDGV